MKKTALIPLLVIVLLACNNKKGIPDVSGIKVDIPVERFDRTFFVTDTMRLREDLQRLQQQHPGFYDDFMQEILGVDGAVSDVNTLFVIKEFIRGYSAIYDSVKSKYNDLAWLRKEVQEAFRFVKYYFPSYKTGKLILFLGPFDAPGVASTASGLAIGLQQFAGAIGDPERRYATKVLAEKQRLEQAVHKFRTT